MLFRANQTGVPRSYRPTLTVICILILIAISLIMSGCSSAKPSTSSTAATTPVGSSQNQPATQPTNTANPTQSAPSSATTVEEKLTLYFPDPDAAGLVPVVKVVKIDNQEIIKAIINELANPPAGFSKPLPPGTKLLSAKVDNGIAYIDLSQEFKKNFVGGSTGEAMALYSIVNSLTTLPNVQAVQFLLEGQKKDAILHEIDTTVPVKRNESLIIAK